MRGPRYAGGFRAACESAFFSEKHEPALSDLIEFVEQCISNTQNCIQDNNAVPAEEDYAADAVFLRKPEKLILEGLLWYSKTSEVIQSLTKTLRLMFPSNDLRAETWRIKFFSMCVQLEEEYTKRGYTSTALEDYIAEQAKSKFNGKSYLGQRLFNVEIENVRRILPELPELSRKPARAAQPSGAGS